MPKLEAGNPELAAELMTRRRFIADEVSGDQAALVGGHADHLARVLRARVGEDFDIATGDAVRRGRITFLENDRVEFDLCEEVSGASLPEITLVLAVFKFDRMEWAIEKCTELGVAKIVPVISRRTDSHLAAASAKRVERWRRLALQAAEQSRRAAPPEIAAPIKISEALNIPAGLRVVLVESEAHTLLRDVVNPQTGDGGVVLAVGPEGGWTGDELHSFRHAGWIFASLGNTILRAETAAMAGVAVAASALHSL
ncbi:MAG: RsmE family RNA methyltransferase [Candidatus Sulfotelmatobacter sp.]